MDSDSGDLLLKMVDGGGTVIAGGSQTVLTSPGRQASPLAKGFVAGSIIEIDNFTLRLGTSGLEPGGTPPPPIHNSGWPTSDKDKDDKSGSIGSLARKGGYQSWRSGLKVKYPLDIQPITFEKPADVSSKWLIESCIHSTSYRSATIIKRKPMGREASGEVYLRIDFSGVLVIKVDWADEDDYIKETVSFIARGITMSYRPQTSASTLGPIVSGFWSMTDVEKQMTFT